MQLGEKTPLPQHPEDAIIEVVPNQNMGTLFVARFTVPEFTSLCPVTGQPDFAHLVIDYHPNETLIESKSLKLFMGSFRNHGAYHEDCTLLIANRLKEACKPFWLRVTALWYPRGGIPIDVFYQTDEPYDGLLLPPLPSLDYKGR